MPSDSPSPQPAGLQAERTRLAWRRTVLAGTACLLLLLRLALIDGPPEPVDAIGLGLGVVSWTALLLAAQRRIRAMRHQQPTSTARLLSVTMTASIGLAASGMLLFLT